MGLINLRNALMAGKRLPYDAEVEFLESTGTQYIDTGVRANQTTSARLLAAFTEIGNDKTFFSVDNGTTFTAAFSLNTWNGLRFVRGTVNTLAFKISANTIYDVSCGPTGMDCDGTHYTIGTTADFETVGTIPLCAWNRNGSIPIKSKCRIYSAKFYQNGVLVFDGIPVRKGTTGELYDRVSGKFAERHGDFVVGQDVVPVEWLEAPGSGTYIMTGVTPAESSTVDFELNIGFAPDSSGARNIIGDGQNNKNHYSSITTADKFGAGNNTTATTLDAATMYNAKTSITSSGITFYITVGGAEESKYLTTYPSATYGEFMLFRRAYNALGTGGARMKSAVMNVNGITMRKFYSVRVGTEGAMMDLLTRRIYRNAGTGAFTYGNDLKYPIPAE